MGIKCVGRWSGARGGGWGAPFPERQHTHNDDGRCKTIVASRVVDRRVSSIVRFVKMIFSARLHNTGTRLLTPPPVRSIPFSAPYTTSRIHAPLYSARSGGGHRGHFETRVHTPLDSVRFALRASYAAVAVAVGTGGSFCGTSVHVWPVGWVCAPGLARQSVLNGPAWTLPQKSVQCWRRKRRGKRRRKRRRRKRRRRKRMAEHGVLGLVIQARTISTSTEAVELESSAVWLY